MLEPSCETPSCGFSYATSTKSRALCDRCRTSEGGGFGTHDRTAALLACHGFTALAYDWCGSYESPVDGLPSKVVDIAIEGPVKALRWLQRHESVRNKPVAIHGFSRGAELAMIIATYACGIPQWHGTPFADLCRVRQLFLLECASGAHSHRPTLWDANIGTIPQERRPMPARRPKH
jgi:BAAT / Acyl-CoA thioester hydrolase C terminal